jgi:serine/threonine protein kinase/Tfp pilus assembly protein PilF
MNALGILDSVRIETDVTACEQCGSTSRVGRGLCLNCLLQHGLDEIRRTETLEAVLDEIDVRDADWRIGNYQILEEIGRGGMGVIYRARQRHSRRIVALKRILSFQADSHETLARFRREAESAASLDHPNILPIYEVSESEDGLPFFSMKFAAGGSLVDAAQALRNDPRRCVALMAKVARAVHYAHNHGILHRDLKPGNILLDGCGEPLVSDFGLAKWLDTSTDLTRTLTIFGTPGYIAPEQAKRAAAKLTATADVYSLGAILFDLFAGRPPFLGEHALAVIEQASEKPAPKLRSLAPRLDRDLETICAKCLEREPQARYQSAADLAHDLECWLEGKPIRARRVLPPTRTWRWSKRNPKLAAAAAVWLCSAIAVAVFFLFSRHVSPPPAPSPSHKSIAVLPFENLSETENADFTQGIHDEILNGLAKVADLKVISRTSVMDYQPSSKRNLRAIAQALGVVYVLEGSVLRAADSVRVRAQLIDARTDTQVWAEKYERNLADVFAIQGEIATAITDQLRAKLLPHEKTAIERPPTDNISAFDLYTRAKSLVESTGRREDLEEAIDLLNQAIALDPSFLEAYCKLALGHGKLYRYGYDHTVERLGLAQAAVQAAFRVRPDAGEAHLAHAQYLYSGHLDIDQALAELEVARRTLPNDPRVFSLEGAIKRRQGHWEESTPNFERAVDLDPRNVHTLGQVASHYEKLWRYADAMSAFDRISAINPDNIDAKCQRAELAIEWKADTQPLRRLIDSVRSTNPAETQKVAFYWLILALTERDAAAAKNAMNANVQSDQPLIDDVVHFSRPFMDGLVARMTKDESKARAAFTVAREQQEKLVQSQPNYGPPLCVLGLIDAALGRKDEALREGRRAVELLPLGKDALNGLRMIKYLAMIAAWTGDKDLACEQLATLTRPPSVVSYGQLKLLPFWDPLRGDPRFEQIVASLAPKEKL